MCKLVLQNSYFLPENKTKKNPKNPKKTNEKPKQTKKTKTKTKKEENLRLWRQQKTRCVFWYINLNFKYQNIMQTIVRNKAGNIVLLKSLGMVVAPVRL